jgi:hypothetical protein
MSGCYRTTACPEQDPIDLDYKPVPDIEWEPREIDFGLVDPVVEAPLVKIVTVCNIGEAGLHIGKIEIENRSESLSVEQPQQRVLPVDDCTSFGIVFDPVSQEEVEDRVIIWNDDPDTPAALIDIAGAGDWEGVVLW